MVKIDDMIHLKNLNPNKIKCHTKRFIHIYHIGCVTVKDLSYATINSVNPICLIINKINGYIEEKRRKKNLTLVHTDESKDRLKKYEELRNKIKDRTRSTNNNSGNYDEKYMKTKFNSDVNCNL